MLLEVLILLGRAPGPSRERCHESRPVYDLRRQLAGQCRYDGKEYLLKVWFAKESVALSEHTWEDTPANAMTASSSLNRAACKPRRTTTPKPWWTSSLREDSLLDRFAFNGNVSLSIRLRGRPSNLKEITAALISSISSVLSSTTYCSGVSSLPSHARRPVIAGGSVSGCD